MKRNLGIFLVILLTIAVYGYLIFISNFSFFIIVREMPEERAKIVSNDVIRQLIPYFVISFVALTLLNFIILKKIVQLESSFLKSFLISIITFIFLFVFVVSFKNKFIEQNKIDYQRILEQNTIH
ncbi:hypothetical protein [Chryseobacterium sp. VAUSW3]|uniref:hypothetical protein n=1 Tax=Chryseobacterium sp. VAUSW3 TaxID=2010998 RepID=UPI000B4DD17B|nr:hypothetical protein [Chryseobacterium sp. VAUSW3]OWR12784.1 hypothetical protein CDW55_12365 [Chryseobacterium sp. VAUSW3]